ncbi:acyltransferase domain-containing protein [Lentzea sp. NPDC034063]|uniref:acyltransferase domain-containing protein n=1 Tax=unclassified Lentzea TaxID=2643253 RepID=UPI003404DC46
MTTSIGLKARVGLFPGQGGYRQGALAKERKAGEPVVREVFGAIDEISLQRRGTAVSPIIFAAEPPTLATLGAEDHDTLQLAILGVSVAHHRLLAGDQPDLLLGHSLGEISALVCGGAWSIEDGASIVCDRNDVLRTHAPRYHGMIALACPAQRAEHLVSLISDDDLVLAVDNSPGQCVLSGPVKLLDAVHDIAGKLGLKATRVHTAYGFHNPALATAGRHFGGKVAGYSRHPLSTPVFSPILGRRYHDNDDLAALLGAHLTNTVHLGAALAGLWAEGVREFVEVGEGGILANLVRTTYPFAVAVSAAECWGQKVREAEPAPVPPSIATPEVVPVVTPLPPVERVTTSELRSVSRPEVVVSIQELFANALEYPVEVLGEEAELEAELGVDSIRKADLLIAVRRKFNIGAPPTEYQSSDYDSIGKIADFVLDRVGSR